MPTGLWRGPRRDPALELRTFALADGGCLRHCCPRLVRISAAAVTRWPDRARPALSLSLCLRGFLAGSRSRGIAAAPIVGGANAHLLRLVCGSGDRADHHDHVGPCLL